MKKLEIPTYAKLKVYWDDKPENYSREGRNRVKTFFARKYGVHKNNINVVFRPTKVDENGKTIEINGAGIDNIMDTNYQRELFKEWLEREEKKVDFSRIITLDNKINGSLEIDVNEVKHRKWELKWLSMNNFLSYGDNNYVNFSKLNGLTIINSTPKNQGGKSTFSVDAIKFLLFGKTTKTDTNSEIFNKFRDDTNEVKVRGMLSVDDSEIIIERVLVRKEKRAGGYAIKNNVSYFRLMPDGEEIELVGEDAKATTNEIKHTIGDESDFDVTILTTAKNLEDLIDSTPTESGKLLTKFIGIEVIELKEKIARKMYNDFSKTMQSNHYDIEELKNDILDNNEVIKIKEIELNKLLIQLSELKKDITKLGDERDMLLVSKEKVDVKISQLNPETIESNIGVITNKGKILKTKINEYINELKVLGDIKYDEIKYFELNKDLNVLGGKLELNKMKTNQHLEMVNQLKNGELCPTCKRALADVDHSSEIKNEEDLIIKLKNEYNTIKNDSDKIKNIIKDMLDLKNKVDLKDKIEIKKDSAEIEIAELRDKIIVKKTELKEYNDNKSAIQFNIDVDNKIGLIKTNIIIEERKKDLLIRDIQLTETIIKTNEDNITNKTKLIGLINKETEVDRLFKIYIEMVGKKGISKLILRSVLPIINSELYRLMDDACDFEIELSINDKNDVVFILTKNNVIKKLKSGSGFEKTVASIALRSVLGKISHLPMPNFITFDEPFGMVADENLIRIKPMFDKIKDMYDIVFLISHINEVKDWSKNIITINKVDDISHILIK